MNNTNFLSIIKHNPDAITTIGGSNEYPNINGNMRFYQTGKGVIVMVEISGLPTSNDKCKSPIFAMHIHKGGSCSGNESDYFANTLTHYNPNNCPHPYHAGDMPPLFSANGQAFSVFLTNRFTVKEIIGKTIVVHLNYDDFTTQPAGNSGKKISCGEIRPFR